MDDITKLSNSPAAEHGPAVSPDDGRRATSTKPRPPRTELGRKLGEIRRRIIASGQPMLDWDAFDREMQERRGESDAEA